MTPEEFVSNMVDYMDVVVEHEYSCGEPVKHIISETARYILKDVKNVGTMYDWKTVYDVIDYLIKACEVEQ